MSFDNDFASLWNAAPVVEKTVGKYDDLPDGKYHGKVNSVKFEMSSKNQEMIAWDFVVVDHPDYEGRHIFHNQFVTTPKGASYAKSQLAALGFAVDTYDQMSECFNSLLDSVIDLGLKTKPATSDYEARQNVYINKLVKKGDASMDDSDNLPF